jgi:rSAM/selenodomain-associated transferase 2
MISIIIPTFNEEENISETIRQVKKRDPGQYAIEIIVSDGHSTDRTREIAANEGATVVISKKKGRAAQMNLGASIAKEEILYFLHADSIPPKRFSNYILDAVKKNAISGCFRLSFDHKHWFLKANCWFTRFNVNAVRFGDQSLFVTKEVFNNCGGFREDLLMMEDQEIIHRVKKYGKFTVMNAEIITSARKYSDNGIYRMQAIFFRIWLLYYIGYSQERLLKLHRRLIRRHKL